MHYVFHFDLFFSGSTATNVANLQAKATGQCQSVVWLAPNVTKKMWNCENVFIYVMYIRKKPDNKHWQQMFQS